MRKIIQLDDYFPTGEATLQPVLLWGGGRQDIGRITKTAAEALDFIKNVRPEPGKTHLLVLALGSEEAYGPNRNGDGFPERPIPAKTKHAAADGRKWWVAPGEELTNHYQSFETNPAHAFQHHQNKDPKKASGYVKKAFWNPKMHRVELLIVVDNQKDPEWVNRVNDGDFPAVSMGCFPAGTLITMEDGTRRSIEDIKVGDVVRTHKGRGRRVTELHRRPYKGPMHAIRAEAHETIRCTDEHPLYVVPRSSVKQKDDKANFRWDQNATLSPDWTHARCVDADEMLLLDPIDNEVSTPDYVDRAFARLFGYYLAEGHILRGRDKIPTAIELTTHQDDAVHAEIEELCHAFGTRNPPHTTTRTNCDVARSILISDPRLAQLCLEHGGGHAKKKKLSLSAMHWDLDMQREMLGAYANGDGHGPVDGSLKLSTASTDLAWQWLSVLARLGICASITNLEHKAGSGFNTQNTYEWVVHVGKQWAQTLRKVCTKIVPAEILAAKNSRRIIDDMIVTPIREMDSIYVEMEVFNFEVEEDNSYVAGGFAVHNCRIKYDVCARCGNQAPTRAQYCDHVRNSMNQVNPDGTKNYVHNPSPNFFDISRVFRPADRTGYTLKKVAHAYELRSSAEMGEAADDIAGKAAAIRKLSDIDKIIRGSPVASSSLSNDEQHLVRRFKDYAGTRLAATPEIPLEAFKGHPLAEALASLQSLDMRLTGPEFVRLVVSRLAGMEPSEEHVRKTASLLPTVLSLYERSPSLLETVLSTGILDTPREKVSTALRVKLAGWAEKKSNVGDLLYRRLVPEGIGVRPDEAPMTDVLNYQDPTSGRNVQTTRGAAMDASDSVTRSNMRKMLGGGALLLGGYKLMGAFPSLRPWRAPAAALGAYAMTRPRASQSFHTTEGYDVPNITEFGPREKMSEDSLSRAVVTLLEDMGKIASSTVNDSFVDELERRGHVDAARGVLLDMDDVADALGSVALS